MDVAAMVLTGGASVRMGRNKATISMGSTTLAGRTMALAAAVAEPVVEIGPGFGGGLFVGDDTAGAGPLAAVATGAAWLAARGWRGAALVLATDLPRLGGPLLAWLAAHPAPATVVPVDSGGCPQPLCARYSADDLSAARRLVTAGRRRMIDLVEASQGITFVPASQWAAVAGADALVDVDTPADLSALHDQAGWTGTTAGPVTSARGPRCRAQRGPGPEPER